VEFRAPQPDGTIRWIAAKGRVSRTGDGAPVSMLGIAIDVSARKRLEQQLQQAQKMESMGQLAGGIAHDFNNLLTAILGFSELLLSELDPADRRARDATEIRKAAESGQGLTRQLLAFSRRAALEPTALDLNAVVRSSEGLLKQLLGSAVRMELRLQEPLANVWADAGQMQQILVNLAVNARDAMSQGGQIHIGTCTATCGEAPDASRPESLTGPQVVLTVTDTGTGMSPETTARIFEPFFTTKGPEKGTGLGLSTVYGIVRQSGGVLDVTSTPGQGTTFWIRLPILNPSEVV
jgi:two-component system cell cycle sensor histidine kinase/response regulator CckA